MTRVFVTPAIVPPSGQVTIHVEDYEGGEEPKNIQVGFSRVELNREVSSFSLGMTVETAARFNVTITLPEGIKHGPHLLTDLRLIAIPEDNADGQFDRQVNLLVGSIEMADISVYFGDASSRPAVDEIRDLHDQRLERIQTRIEVGTVPTTSRLRVAYLYNELLVHGQQHCDGYSVLPYGSGLAPTSMLSAINEFSAGVFGGTFQMRPEQMDEFRSQQPLAAILFHNVGAASSEEAMRGTRSRAEEISLALAFERGHPPQPFGCVVEDGNNISMWLLHRLYRGNLLSPFGPTDQGAEVERLTTAMTNSPFSKLLLQLYVQANSEEDPMFMFFRFWAILELLAKRAIPENSHHIVDVRGERIRGRNGDLIQTSKAEAKVYKYLFDQGAGGSYSSIDTPNGPFTLIVEGVQAAPPLQGAGLRISFWEFIEAAYAIRNGVAHEGRFTPHRNPNIDQPAGLASQILLLNGDGFLSNIGDVARLAVLRELNKLSQLN